MNPYFVVALSAVIVVSVLNNSASAQVVPRAPSGYFEHVGFALSRGRDELDGRIQVLEDARIQPAMREAIRVAWGDDPCAGSPPTVLMPLCSAPGYTPLRPALLRLLDSRGRVIAQRAAERPLADLAAIELYGTRRRTYFFTVDLSVDVGSYAGPYTILSEPAPDGFGWLRATDSLGTRSLTIRLVSTLKSGWRLVSRSDSKGRDILMVRCRPDFSAVAAKPDSASFVLIFDRFSFERSHWVRYSRTEPGCWENDDSASFPRAMRFP